MKKIFFILAHVLFIMFLYACGSSETNTTSAPYKPSMPSKNATPSLDNFSEWKNIWDGETWILAHDSDQIPLLTSDYLRRNFASALRSTLPANNFNFDVFAFANTLQIEILHIAKTKQLSEEIGGFSTISFAHNKNTLINTLLPMMFSSNLATEKNSLALQWSILQKMRGIKWAEPNLQSELFTYTYPPEIAESEQVSSILKLIRADEAWKNSLSADGLPRYEYGIRRNLNWTNVAIIDTGVDYYHTDLYSKDENETHIFKNPREVLDGIDNDGNGYVDDIYGIDATLSPEEWNSQAVKSAATNTLPIPGSADLGGPGKECPTTTSTNEAVKKASHSCGHGTHVAGIIAAKHGSDTATAGVCPSCRVIPLRVTEQKQMEDVLVDGSIGDIAQIRAIKYIIDYVDASGAPYVRIVNMSLGKYFISRSLAYWFRRLYENDILVVAAAGNDDTDTPSYPAAYSPVLAVCATSRDGDRGNYSKTTFSNFGAWVDICAPGKDILSTIPGNEGSVGATDKKDGTSQATPVVAGAVGFLKSLDPTLSPSELTKRITRYSNAVSLYFNPEKTTEYNKWNILYSGWFENSTRYFLLGAGFLDLGAAATQGTSCAATNGNCISFVYDGGYLGQQTQIEGGCVVSSITHYGLSKISSSMPFVLIQLWLLLVFIRKMMRKKNRA